MVVGEVALVDPKARWPERFRAAQEFWATHQAALISHVDAPAYRLHKEAGLSTGGVGRSARVVPDYARGLRLGLGGVAREVREARQGPADGSARRTGVTSVTR